MQSKSFQTKTQRMEVKKQNETFDFVKFYEPTGETNLKAGIKGKHISFCDVEDGTNSKENVNKLGKAPNRKMQENNSNNITKSFISDMLLNDSKATSTPKLISKKSGDKVKSIMKINSAANEILDSSAESTKNNVSSKRKKRNKSVSFMLDDTDTVVKKSKSDTSQQLANEEVKIKKIKMDQLLKQDNAEKENESMLETIISVEETLPNSKKMKRVKKPTKMKVNEVDVQINTNEKDEQIAKKSKKKKRQAKVHQDNSDVEEPASKSRKKNDKQDLIAESLENLNIGDNAHTLTNLIDKMTVVDKSKKKKKSKKGKGVVQNKDTPGNEKSTEEIKEKVKWVKKKWNKGRKDFIHDDRILQSVIIENLPLSIMLTYKSILTEHFSICGHIRQIGIAELYPADDTKPVFNSTILFDTEDAATKALEEDNTLLEGSRIRVRKSLPHSQTTIVVRTYADLTEQILSTLFSGAGRIRKINLIVKGKKMSSTAFIEFTSPDAVERAITSAEGVQVNRKKINVFRYQEQYAPKKRKGNKQEDSEMNESD